MVTAQVDIPFNLDAEKLMLESGADAYNLREGIIDLVENSSHDQEDSVERIMRATVLLKQANPDASLGACLHTAIVWERG